MGIGDFVKSQFIDVIEHIDETNKLLVYKYTRDRNEIKQGARLIVRNGQIAVFVCKGQIADIFKPGDYKLETGNLPLLSSLAALPYLMNSPIKSDLYFINTTQFINNRWGTKNPIIKRDDDLGVVRISSFGTYSFRVSDVKLFVTEVFGARSLNMTYDIIQYLTSMVSESIAQCLGETTVSILDLATNYRQLSKMLKPYINDKANTLGLEVLEVIIENIGLPEEVEKLIDEQSGIGLATKNMGSFVQYQSARAIRDVAKQPGGMAGIGAGIAVSKVIAENMTDSLKNEKRDNKNKKNYNDNFDDNKNDSVVSVADKIMKYKRLLDEGILTQDEFTELKTKLIKEIQ